MDRESTGFSVLRVTLALFGAARPLSGGMVRLAVFHTREPGRKTAAFGGRREVDGGNEPAVESP